MTEMVFTMKKRQTIKEGDLFACEPQPQAEHAYENDYDLNNLFERLAKSKFRSSFHLRKQEREYVAAKGLDTIRHHAEEFVRTRLAPAVIPNDGKQTPYRGHPVFLAQHATGCCCRGCFEKWHHIHKGKTLTADQQRYAVAVLMTWIERQIHSNS